MSIEAVNQFFAKVQEDENLQAKLSQAMETQNKAENIAKLAANHDYNFTNEELKSRVEEIDKVRAKQSANQELNEEELEAVAGGFCTPAIAAGAAGGLLGPSLLGGM